MKVSDEFKLPLSVNDTYAEKELRDSNGDLVVAGRYDAHSLRVLAGAANEHDQLKTDLDRAINAGAAHADRADELYAENVQLRKALNDIVDSASEEVVWLGGSAVTVDFNALNDAEELLTKLEKGE